MGEGFSVTLLRGGSMAKFNCKGARWIVIFIEVGRSPVRAGECVAHWWQIGRIAGNPESRKTVHKLVRLTIQDVQESFSRSAENSIPVFHENL